MLAIVGAKWAASTCREGRMTLTDTELLAIFNKPLDEAKWVPSVTNEEYTSIVTYLIRRNVAEQ